jgi:sterol desaturase/sphingolipid hydroxylase (fatty acid hydroxylase superfamily)
MDDRAIAYAIPFFFVAILAELAWNVSRGDSRYRFHDSIGSLACGVGQIMIDAAFRFLSFGGYVYAWRHFRLGTISEHSFVAWIAITVALDLCYYAFHRASHRVNFLWAMHAVHHQSEEYNLSTALRQAWFDPLVQWVFYLPLALAGFTPAMYAMAATINLLYQFFLHTRAVKRLGPLEWIFNTPSHHRVHHGIDPEYIDKNYAGIFIVWDRLFGTFVNEGIEPVYGTVKPLESFNAAWANVAEFGRIAQLARRATLVSEKIYAWFAPPEWRPVALGGVVTVPPVDRARYRKFETPSVRALDLYVGANFVAGGTATAFLLYFAEELPRGVVMLLASCILAATFGWGRMMEGKGGAQRYEIARWIVTIAVMSLLAWRGLIELRVAVLVGAVAFAFGVWSALLPRERTVRARDDARSAMHAR